MTIHPVNATVARRCSGPRSNCHPNTRSSLATTLHLARWGGPMTRERLSAAPSGVRSRGKNAVHAWLIKGVVFAAGGIFWGRF
jgi:hypothetical protein